MKTLLPLTLCSAVAALCLGTGAARAGYVTPRVPAVAAKPALQSASDLRNAPQGLPATWSVTSANDSGPGSLREAIANAAPGDSITFDLPAPATILLSSTLVIAKDLLVLGPGAEQLTVMRSDAPGTPDFRVFDVTSGVVTLAGMTIRNGSAYSGTNIHDNLGGGILNYGTLTVCDCVVTANRALTTDWGTGFTPRYSLGFGAGVFTAPGSQLTLLRSTISGNYATAAGGGLATWYVNAFLASGCTLSGNSADIQGGGLNFQGVAGSLVNCTLSGNSTPPDGYASAFLQIIWPGETATLTFTACTIAANTGSTNGACIIYSVYGNPGITNCLLSTLVAENEGPNFVLEGNPVLQSLGHNLDSDGTSGLVNGVNDDLVGTPTIPIDPKLGPLQDNDGPTFTMALLPGSPALDAGACADATGAPLLVDQRGFPRPQGAGCDIGAYEYQPVTPPWCVKSNVLAELTALRATVDPSHPLVGKFDLAIRHLANSLNPAWWIDQSHLELKGGNIAINEEKLAAVQLDLILKSQDCPVNLAVIQDFINRILKADRLLAVISIEEAAAAGLNPRKIAQDLAMVLKGDEEAAAGRYANAIEHYRNAWRHALQLRLRVTLIPTGAARVEFVGNNSKCYLIQRSQDLVNWVIVGSCAADAAGNVVFTDPDAQPGRLRLYRAVEQHG